MFDNSLIQKLNDVNYYANEGENGLLYINTQNPNNSLYSHRGIYVREKPLIYKRGYSKTLAVIESD